MSNLKIKKPLGGYLDKPFEPWSPPKVETYHYKSPVWQAAAKVMQCMHGKELSDYKEYIQHLFNLGIGKREQHKVLTPVCRPNVGWWKDTKAEEYTGLAKKEYENLCWLARPRILFDKFSAIGKADRHLYIILYGEWAWMQVLALLFPDINFLATVTEKSSAQTRAKVYYRYYFDSKGKLRFAYLNINQPQQREHKAILPGSYKARPEIEGAVWGELNPDRSPILLGPVPSPGKEPPCCGPWPWPHKGPGQPH